MFALLILPILVSGFIVLSINPYHRIKLYRYDGQLLYLKAAKIGLRYFLVVSALSFFLKNYPISFSMGFFGLYTLNVYFDPSLVTHISKAISALQNNAKITHDIILYSWLLSLSLLTIFSAYVLSLIIKVYVNFLKYLARKNYDGNDTTTIILLGRILKDSPIDSIFYESFAKKKHILISLSSRKVYIGMVNKLGEPSESEEPNQEISLVPVISGYRDKDTLKVILQNEYSNLPQTDIDSSIVIRVDEIETVSWFNHSVYDDVNDNMTVEKKQKNKETVSKCVDCRNKMKLKIGAYAVVKD
ncbi:TPA: hypothetical protein ACX6QT_000047 [Photobacterium damselae]|uniref:hypothetical protein n=1 Tax=Photobacterium damselae TaxID=38293 RepID=UPI003B674DC8